MKTSARMTGESEYRNPAMVVARHSAAKETIKVETASAAECHTRNSVLMRAVSDGEACSP
jgi:hypothetical protein